jgi:hypothetical protein
VKPWVAQRMTEFLPLIAPLTLADEEKIAALCAAEVEGIRQRPGLKSRLSWKEPLKDMRTIISVQIPLTDQNSYINRRGQREHIALKYLTFTDEEWASMSQPSAKKAQERLTHQSFIRRPDEVVERMRRLIGSNRWEEVAAGLSCATGRRLAEVLRFGVVREKSLYSVWFGGQRKTSIDGEYEIQTLVPAHEVVQAWNRLRMLRDFSGVESNSISANFGAAVKAVVVDAFADLIESPEGRAELYTHALRAVYPRLCMFYFLPPRVNETAYANALLGHIATEGGELKPNYQSTLFYMSYKIIDENGAVDGREGIKLGEPGVEVLEQFKERKSTMEATTVAVKEDRTKIGVNRSTKVGFDEEQQAMGCATADEAVQKLVADHKVYRQLEALIGGDDVATLVAVLSEASEIRLENESLLDAMRAALKDKARFRAQYGKRSEANAERDLSGLSLEELAKIRTPSASAEKWRRGVDMIMAYNDRVEMPELRWYINASAVKMLVGGRGTDIGKYLKSRQSELDEHHKKNKLTPGRNHGRTNIRERVMGANAAPMEDDEE